MKEPQVYARHARFHHQRKLLTLIQMQASGAIRFGLNAVKPEAITHLYVGVKDTYAKNIINLIEVLKDTKECKRIVDETGELEMTNFIIDETVKWSKLHCPENKDERKMLLLVTLMEACSWFIDELENDNFTSWRSGDYAPILAVRNMLTCHEFISEDLIDENFQRKIRNYVF